MVMGLITAQRPGGGPQQRLRQVDSKADTLKTSAILLNWDQVKAASMAHEINSTGEPIMCGYGLVHHNEISSLYLSIVLSKLRFTCRVLNNPPKSNISIQFEKRHFNSNRCIHIYMTDPVAIFGEMISTS